MKYNTDILDSLNSLLPQAIKKVEHGYGSFLTFEFLNATTNKTMQLWIYMCDWILFQANIALLNSTSVGNHETINILENLNGVLVQEIKEISPRETIDILMDKEYRLRLNVCSEYDIEDDFFILFIEDNRIISYSSEGGFKSKIEKFDIKGKN